MPHLQTTEQCQETYWLVLSIYGKSSSHVPVTTNQPILENPPNWIHWIPGSWSHGHGLWTSLIIPIYTQGTCSVTPTPIYIIYIISYLMVITKDNLWIIYSQYPLMSNMLNTRKMLDKICIKSWNNTINQQTSLFCTSHGSPIRNPKMFSISWQCQAAWWFQPSWKMLRWVSWYHHPDIGWKI